MAHKRELLLLNHEGQSQVPSTHAGASQTPLIPVLHSSNAIFCPLWAFVQMCAYPHTDPEMYILVNKIKLKKKVWRTDWILEFNSNQQLIIVSLLSTIYFKNSFWSRASPQKPRGDTQFSILPTIEITNNTGLPSRCGFRLLEHSASDKGIVVLPRCPFLVSSF